MNDFLVWVGSECGIVSPVEDADDISGVGDAEPCVLCEHAGCEASVIDWDRFWAALSAEQVRLGIKPDPAPTLRAEIPHRGEYREGRR